MKEKFVGTMGLVAQPKPEDDELLLNLKKNIRYPILQDNEGNEPGTGKILAKVIDISGRKTYKPNNDTAAVLLYLLARDYDDHVLLGDYIKFVKDNLPKSVTEGKMGDIDDAIRSFLHKLETVYKILDIEVAHKGKQGAIDIDPVGMVSSLGSFDYELDLIPRDPPIVKKNTCFSTGYRVVPR